MTILGGIGAILGVKPPTPAAFVGTHAWVCDACVYDTERPNKMGTPTMGPFSRTRMKCVRCSTWDATKRMFVPKA